MPISNKISWQSGCWMISERHSHECKMVSSSRKWSMRSSDGLFRHQAELQGLPRQPYPGTSSSGPTLSVQFASLACLILSMMRWRFPWKSRAHWFKLWILLLAFDLRLASTQLKQRLRIKYMNWKETMFWVPTYTGRDGDEMTHLCFYQGEMARPCWRSQWEL